MKRPYAAKNPSVSSVRPNSRAMMTPMIAAKAETTRVDGRRQRSARQRAQAGRSGRWRIHAKVYGRSSDQHYLDRRRSRSSLCHESGDVYEGRTALVMGADGFMASHPLTEALVQLGAIGCTPPVRAHPQR